MKKGIKKFHIYATSLSLLLTSCGVDANTILNDNSSNVILQEEADTISNNNNSSIILEKETNYRERCNTSLTYDDMILTLEEKGVKTLSNEARNAIADISGYNPLLFDFSWVKLLQIDDYYSLAYTNYNISNPITNHLGSQYYNEKEDSIYWDKLVDVIRKNSMARAGKANLLSQIENSNEGCKVEALSEEEIIIILDQMANFVKDVKEEYSDYDMAHLACQLSTLALTYRINPINIDSNILATTTAFDIQWYVNDKGEYPVFTSSITLDEHEFKHFLCQGCWDEYDSNPDCYAVPSGVIYYGKDSLRFNFIEEATAELHATDRNQMNPVTYFEKIEILDNLRFVLSLQDDYEEDGFMKYSLLQNPLAMVQQFTVIEEQSYYFAYILKMLASYNVCLTKSSSFIQAVRKIEGYEDFYNHLDQKKEVYSAMGNYAQLELSRLFLTNLIVMNDQKESMSLEYNFYLMRLFEKRVQLGYDAMSDYHGFTMSSANYGQAYQYKLGYFFRYLSSKYQVDYKNLEQLYDEYSLDDGVQYPDFVDQSRHNFYQDLQTRQYDGKQLREDASKSMQYYIEYSTRD